VPDPVSPRVTVQAQLSVRRGRDAVAFYKEAFGAVEVFRFESEANLESPAEVVAQLAVGDSLFWVEDESPENHNFSPETLRGTTERMLLMVDDPKAVVEHALTLGAEEVYPVQEAHGWLLGRIVDPFGHHWELGKPLDAWPPAASSDKEGR
jgi:PhnB protein